MIFIIGANRCGSSLIGKIVKGLGIDINCDDEKPADRFKRGYCEVQEDPRLKFIVDVAYPSKSSNHCLVGEYTEKEELKIREGLSRLPKNVGMKWRRLLAIMPLLIKYGKDPKVIFCKRNPKAQAKSKIGYLLSGKKFRVADIIKGIEEYNNIVYKYFKDKPFLEVHFENLVENPEKETKRIADFLGVKYKKLNIVKPRLKHF